MERSRKLRLGLAVLLAAGIFGYRYYQDNAGSADASAATPGDATATASAPPAPPRMYGEIAFEPCTLASPFGVDGIEAQCGKYSVAENPAEPDGRQVELNLAWIPAGEDAELAPDPVLLLAGGPGQAATMVYPQAAAAFREIRDQRHVILLDQRGTGGSNPLECEFDEDTASDADAIVRATTRCRDQLAEKADLRFYTTSDAVRDLESVRKALGVEQLNLVGVSYGTRVAQQYAMRHPEHTRTIVLDSVAPNTLILGNDFAVNLEQALDLQFARCTESDTCAQQVGNPREQLDRLAADLQATRRPEAVRLTVRLAGAIGVLVADREALGPPRRRLEALRLNWHREHQSRRRADPLWRYSQRSVEPPRL